MISKIFHYFNYMLNRARENAHSILSKYQSKFTPEYIKSADFELGIDQAGRGPVFGSMIYSALWWPIQLRDQLGSIGFDDSKQLTEQQRQKLLELINEMRGKLIFYKTFELTAEYISTSMNNQINNINLNQMSHAAALQLVRDALGQGFKITHIYADTVGDPNKYRSYFLDNLKDYQHIIKNVTVQPKADRDFKVVSASSICAKVTRDLIIKQWKFRQNKKFDGQLGSGYPGDPKTKAWLQQNKHKVFGYPNLVRFSWSTSVNALEGLLKIKLKDQGQDETILKKYNIFKHKKELNKDLFEMIPK